MNAIDIAVIVIVCVAFCAIIGWLIYRKVKGKGGVCCSDCGGSCPSCNACPHCNTQKEEK